MAKKLFRISWSEVKAWKHCRKKHDYAYRQGLKKKARPVQFIRGNILHDCIRAIALDKPWKPVINKYAKEYNKLFKEEKEYYGDIIGECTGIIERYLNQYPRDKYQAVECEIVGNLGDGIEIKAYIDGVASTGERKGSWLIEHKSHKKIPEEEARYNDIQTVLYYPLAEKQLGIKLSGVLWDYLRTKPPAEPQLLKRNRGLSKRKNIDTTYDVYLETIKKHGLDPKDYKDILNELKLNEEKFFERVYLPNPSKSLIDNVYDDFKSTAITIRDNPELKDRNMTRDCSRFCEFYELCSAEFRGLDSKVIRKTQYISRYEESKKTRRK